jgi:hypothetical protein
VQISQLEPGDTIHIWAEGARESDTPAFSIEIAEKDRIWVVAESLGLKLGDRVLILRSVAGDARYQAPYEVVSLVAASVAFEALGDWQRVQDRGSIRAMTPNIPVTARSRGSGAFEMTMLNLSNGGMMVESAVALAPGDEFDCRFRLPECETEFNLSARVVRQTRSGMHPTTQHCLAVQFLRLSDSIEAGITRFVFREEIRRNNIRKIRRNIIRRRAAG